MLYAAAYVTTDILGKMPKKNAGRKKAEQFWKRRIKNSIVVWRRDLSKIEEFRRGRMKLGERDQRRMDQKYQLRERGTLYVSDMLKQKIRAGGIKIKRYDERCLQFHQNTLFRTNQKFFYDELDGVKDGQTGIPDLTASTEFWSNLWSDDVVHNEGSFLAT